MNHILLVSHDNTWNRVAILENNIPVEVHVAYAHADYQVGHIYKGRVLRALPGMQASFVDIGLQKAAFLYAGDATPQASDAPNDSQPIETLLHKGDTLVVQIKKAGFGSKGPRVTKHVSLPGRFLVYTPFAKRVGLSQRITDTNLRAHLEAVATNLMHHMQSGWVVRTAAIAATDAMLQHEAHELHNTWQHICNTAQQASVPSLLFGDVPASLRVVRDCLSADTTTIWVDTTELLHAMQQFVASVQPDCCVNIQLHTDGLSLFETFGIERVIAQALKRQVWLKNGSCLIFDEVEALTAIDVNSGSFVGDISLEETVTAINIAAAKVIAKQLRLRNIGGIIVIDFIDMLEAAHRMQVLQALRDALSVDKAKTHIVGMSEIGLVEMTRKKVRPSLRAMLTHACAACAGTGRIHTKANNDKDNAEQTILADEI